MSPKVHPLHATPVDELLRTIRARQRAGLPMDAGSVANKRIQLLARYHFGGWYQAVSAAGLKPVGRHLPKREHRPPRKRLAALTEELLRGERTSSELERMSGIQAEAIRKRRRRLGIVRDERLRKDESWLETARPLMGRLPDRQIALRCGVSKTQVTRIRMALGIPSRREAERSRKGFDRVPRSEALRLVRERARAGKPLLARYVDDRRLRELCEHHFGSWKAALEAAGLEPEDRITRIALRKDGEPRPLTEALLRGPLPDRVLHALTRVSRTRIRERRRRLGIARDDQLPDREWLKAVRADLGKLPDAEIARRVGQSDALIRKTRLELGIPAPQPVSRATKPEIRSRLEAHGRRALERAIDTLDRRSAMILRQRLLRDPPLTQAAIARRLGITVGAVSAREQVAVPTVLAILEAEGRPRRGEQGKQHADHAARRATRRA